MLVTVAKEKRKLKPQHRKVNLIRQAYYAEETDVLEWVSDGKYKVIKRTDGSITGYVGSFIYKAKDKPGATTWSLVRTFKDMEEADAWYRSWTIKGSSHGY